MGALGEADSSVSGAAPPRQARLNLATTVAGFAISVGVGLWFTPYLLHALGPAAYGLIPLATTVVSYFSLLSQTLGASLTRVIGVALASGDAARANRAFSSALGGVLLLAAALAPPLAALAWWSPSLFAIPPGAEAATQGLFAIVAAAFLVALVSTPYQSVAFARNRIYLTNAAAIAQTLIRVGATLLAFAFAATLTGAGAAILLGAAAALALNIAFARASAPALRGAGPALDRDELRDMSRTSSHVLLMQIGTVLTMSCELVIVNRLFGSHEGGRYAAAMQWLLLLRNAATALVVLCVPTILALIAERRTADVVDYTRRAMLLTAICIALPVGYLCGLAPQILAIWLGPGFADLWPVMVVQLAPLAVTAAVVPLYSVTLGTDRVLPAAIVQLAVALLGILLALAPGAGWGPAWVAAAVGWSFALKEIAFTPVYAARNLGIAAHRFMAPLVAAGALSLLAAGLGWAAGWLVEPQTMAMLGAAGALVALGYGVVVAVAARSLLAQALRTFFGR